jgi:hypothetical protein
MNNPVITIYADTPAELARKCDQTAKDIGARGWRLYGSNQFSRYGVQVLFKDVPETEQQS